MKNNDRKIINAGESQDEKRHQGNIKHGKDKHDTPKSTQHKNKQKQK